MEGLEISWLIKELEKMMNKALEWRQTLSDWNPDADKKTAGSASSAGGDDRPGKDQDPTRGMFRV